MIPALEIPPLDIPALGGRPDKVLELRGIGRQFGTDPPVHALVNIDLSLYRGDWLTITGPSGAGKSTLLNIIGCLDSPTSGRYFIDGPGGGTTRRPCFSSTSRKT